MTLDTRLRDALHTFGETVDPPAPPIEALTAGVRRRRVRRVRAASALAVIAVAVPIAGPALWAGRAEPAGVPWRNAPFDLGDDAARSSTLYAVRICTATDLLVTFGPALGGRPGTRTVTAVNASPTACRLVDTPTLAAGGTPVPTTEAPESDVARTPSASLDPGGAAEARVLVPGDCANPSAAVEYVRPVLGYGGGGWPLGEDIATRCGVLVSKFVAAVVAPRLTDPLAVVGIQAPAGTRAGGTYDFRVALRATDAIGAGARCPVYVVAIGPSTRAYRLNCGGVSMAAGETRWFDMRVTIPAGLARGAYPLAWWIYHATDPTSATALVTVG